MGEHSSQNIQWEKSLHLLIQAGRLKNTPRTGWAVRGIPAFESVADHTCGVAMCALVLLDLLMPEVDGYDLIRIIEQLGKHSLLPGPANIVVLTGDTDYTRLKQLVNYQCVYSVRNKPLQKDELLRDIERMLERKMEASN